MNRTAPNRELIEHRSRRSPHSASHIIRRSMWYFVQATLFRFSPRIAHGWRRMLLRLFGCSIHSTARVYSRAKVWAPWNLEMGQGATIGPDVDVYCVDKITLEPFAAVSQYSYLCGASHDFEDVAFPLTPAPITIKRRAWVAADVFVAPGVTIGEGAVIGARSAVFKDIPPWVVAAGSPAQPIRDRTLGPEDYGDPPTNDASADA